MVKYFSNWRTTTAGAGALVFAIVDLVVLVHNKEWDSNKIGIDVLAILTGIGLVSARDAVASAEDHHLDRVAIAETAAVALETKEAIKEVAAVAAPEVKVS